MQFVHWDRVEATEKKLGGAPETVEKEQNEMETGMPLSLTPLGPPDFLTCASLHPHDQC